MKADVIVGIQWGDEGKGKIVDNKGHKGYAPLIQDKDL